MNATVVAQTTFMLAASNLFMLLAWYGHLKHFSRQAVVRG
jgi:uncharacterized protein (DUF486 family)